jgi:invasion protein IalB
VTRTLSGIAALSFLFCSLAAARAQTATPQPPAATAPKPADDKTLICIRQEPGSGQRLAPQRVCHTQDEWDKLQGKSR